MSYTFCDGKITCPYNRSHVVSQLRVLQHVTNCRQQNPHLAEVIGICPYNQAHHVPLEDLKMHLQSCREYAAFQMYEASINQSRLSKGTSEQKRTSTDAVTNDSLPSSAESEVDDDIAEWM